MPRGTARESSPASDQASAGINRASAISASRTAGPIGADGVDVIDAAGVNAVALASSGPRDARNAPPMAAVSCVRGVVTTGTPRLPDSMVVTAGMFAPPPTETTATSSESRIPLRLMVSSKTATKI